LEREDLEPDFERERDLDLDLDFGDFGDLGDLLRLRDLLRERLRGDLLLDNGDLDLESDLDLLLDAERGDLDLPRFFGLSSINVILRLLISVPSSFSKAFFISL